MLIVGRLGRNTGDSFGAVIPIMMATFLELLHLRIPESER